MRAFSALVLAILLAGVALPTQVGAASPPANDRYWYATSLGGNSTITQSIVGATYEPWYGPCTGDADVWFRVQYYNATAMRIEASADGFVPILTVYSSDISPVCDIGALGEPAVVDLQVGRYPWVYFRVAGQSNATGDITVSVTVDDSLAPYDVSVGNLWLDNTAVVGEPVQAFAYVYNEGRPLDVEFNVSFYLGGAYGEVRVPAMGSNYSHMVSVSLTPYYYGENVSFEAYADSRYEIVEASEWNNGYYTYVDVLPPPDATVNLSEPRRIPLRTELGDQRHPLAMWEIDVEICNRGGRHIPVSFQLDMLSGGEYSGATANLQGNVTIETMETYAPQMSCWTHTVRFSTAQAVGDFTLHGYVSSPRDSYIWNNEDFAYGYNLVGDTFSVVVDTDGP